MGLHGDDPTDAVLDSLVLQVCGFVLIATFPPLSLTAVCASDFTPCGHIAYSWLDRHSSAFWIGLGAVLGLAGYLLDVHRWTGVLYLVALANYLAVATCLFFGILFLTGLAPSMPIIMGIFISLLGTFAVRRLALRDTPTAIFMLGTGLVFGVYAAGLAVTWVVWAFTAFGGYDDSDFHHSAAAVPPEASPLDDLTYFVLWCSPLILSFACLLVSLFAMLRGKIHAPSNHEETEEVFIAMELRVILGCLALAVMGAWIAASLAAKDMGLSMTVLRLSAAMGVFIAVYVGYVIGLRRLRRVAKTISAVQLILDLVHGDITKGAFLLFAWPLLPVYFAFEVLHHAVRSCLTCVGVGQVGDGRSHTLITEEAQQHWEELQSWNKASVLTKSMWIGILYVTIQVGISKGVTVFLSWLGDTIAPMSLSLILAVLFAIGEVMFLLPPVPGLPIYLISGIVIVQRCQNDGWSFWLGTSLAVVFSFLLKMVAILLQQKGIGQPFSHSVTVKKLVAIHTPTMKAVRHILKRPGWDSAKVAVLVGGPDWPTSVLTGILQLNAGQMLLGSTPIIFLIAPVVLAGAFTLKSAQDDKSNNMYSGVAEVMTMLSSVVLVSMMIIAGYYIEAVQQQFKAEIAQGDWEKDPQEDEVRQAIEEDEKQSKVYEQLTRWNAVPTWLQTLLFFGSVLMSAVIYLILFADPFEPFSIADHAFELPGGSVLGLVHTTGWASIVCLLAAVAVLTTFQVWCFVQVRALSCPEETKPLTSEEDPRVAASVLAHA
eukprot:TRINITY_DN2690_c0_g1_i1.p1 TRINITY_DN2690_c0_g1~~TRINITY_DN2690_c0_g1_i1.p1  ORF type:complete len:769 (+),score=144.25 TRINITY_DN2690_c0_g1_i1:105-2411(+)